MCLEERIFVEDESNWYAVCERHAWHCLRCGEIPTYADRAGFFLKGLCGECDALLWPMRQGRPKKRAIVLNDTERERLMTMARSRSLPHGAVRRAQMILRSAQGETTSAIAKGFGLSVPTVSHWRNRYLERGIAGLHEGRSGRPRTYDDERVAELIDKTLRSRPKNVTHWTIRSIANETGISKSTVHRYFNLFGLQPVR